MILTDFIRRAPRRDLQIMLGLSGLSGAANAVLILAVNQAAQQVTTDTLPGAWDVAMYAGAFLAFFFGNKFALLRATQIIERLLQTLRVEIMDRLRGSELRRVEALGRKSLYSMISEQANSLSMTFPLLIDSLQQAVLMVMALIYLTWLSPYALGVFIIVILAASILYRALQREIRVLVERQIRRQMLFVDTLEPFLSGGKELRLNHKRSDALFVELQKRSLRLRETLVKVGDSWTELMLLGNGVTYLVIGFIIFYFPGNVSGYGTVVFQIIPVLLFSLNPLIRIAVMAPAFLQVDAGLSAVLTVRDQLTEVTPIPAETVCEKSAQYADFTEIRFEDVRFCHDSGGDPDSFTFGPLSLTLRRGETVFVTGGNGSGKSTFAHLLCGLHVPDQGMIRIDDTPVNEALAQAGFRALFSAVFVDYHLFDRLYGLEHVDPDRVNTLIVDMGLGDKLKYENGTFSTLSLSTGQRKRLALIVAILEDRPVIVLDEWSAEQDVHFRDRFYTEIVPMLAERGQTVIAITHDERYWGAADRILKFEQGQLVEDSKT
ncbi:ATP-binding cassette domain-containing protein [Labrenzia sp. PHM005]|uniref:ATP-binding cassette domain-containing protein n=1 Tax=Labrenzia sp. PHM005 TaxID=2590016 RepID=UPI00143D41C5|nr:ATP-binding cassette domain-containing protein [Labrenzia sp. PHM005]